MSPVEIIAALRAILEHVPPNLLKEAIDMIEARHPDPVAEFEVRRAALYAALQYDADRRWGGKP